ncbi:MAG: Chorismate synthase [Chlamydiae bacterium]|nr:Chorismate synthase [Chlamydiota bacterium]
MASNQFGQIFRITTWGESHGKAIGVVIDGCPAGLFISEEEINLELILRRPGYNALTSPRKEEDKAEIYSGVFEGRTTGAPISIIIPNQNADPSKYEPIKDLLRPGHANFTYGEKYGHFDYRGGGRASARETAPRVAAGAIAKKLLMEFGIQIAAFVAQIGEVKTIEPEHEEIDSLREETLKSPVFCPDKEAEREIIALIEKAKEEGDSLGAIIELRAEGLMPVLGDPTYEKLDANLAKAMLSIPACKGIEFGAGFAAANMKGSEHNDLFQRNIEGNVITKTNHAGGVLGGISSGMPLVLRCVFKPTSSIRKTQTTLNKKGQKADLTLPEGSKHDPCVAIRAVPIVEAMTALVLADAFLMNRSARITRESAKSYSS